MLLDLDKEALGKYLNPNKAKLLSKGVDSVISRVMNLKERIPDITHDKFCSALADSFKHKWSTHTPHERILTVSDLNRIPKLRELYENYSKWEWRFGETPKFTNGIEKKFDWAMVDIEFNVEKGRI